MNPEKWNSIKDVATFVVMVGFFVLILVVTCTSGCHLHVHLNDKNYYGDPPKEIVIETPTGDTP